MSASISADQSITSEDITSSEYFPDSVDISTSTLPTISTSNNTTNSTSTPSPTATTTNTVNSTSTKRNAHGQQPPQQASRQSTNTSVRPPYQTDTEPPRGVNFKVIFHPGLHVDHSGKYGNRKVYRLNGQVGPHESPIILTDPRLTTTQRKPRLRQELKQGLELTEFLYDKNSRGPPPPTSVLLSNLPVMKESTIKAMFLEYGRDLDIRLENHPITGGFIGLARITYVGENPRTAARRAVEKGNGRRIGSNNVVVEFDPDGSKLRQSVDALLLKQKLTTIQQSNTSSSHQNNTTNTTSSLLSQQKQREITPSSHNNDDDMEIGDAPTPPSISQLPPPSYPYIIPSSTVPPIQRMNGPPPVLYPNSLPMTPNRFYPQKGPSERPFHTSTSSPINTKPYTKHEPNSFYHYNIPAQPNSNNSRSSTQDMYSSRSNNYSRKQKPPLPTTSNTFEPLPPPLPQTDKRYPLTRPVANDYKASYSYPDDEKEDGEIDPYYDDDRRHDRYRHQPTTSRPRSREDDLHIYGNDIRDRYRRDLDYSARPRVNDDWSRDNNYKHPPPPPPVNRSRNPSEPSFSRNGSRSSRTREHKEPSNNKRAKDRPPHQPPDVSQILQQSTKILISELSEVFQKDLKNKVVGKFIFDYLTPKIQERKQQRLAKLKSKNEEKKQQPEMRAREFSELGPFESKYSMLHGTKLNGNGLRDYDLKFRMGDSDFRDRRSGYNKDQNQSSITTTIGGMNNNKRPHPSSKYDNNRSNKKINSRKSPPHKRPAFEFTDSENEDGQGEKSEDLATCSNKQEASSSSEEGEIHTDDELFPENQKSPPKQESLEKPKHTPFKVEKPRHQQQRLRDYLSEDDDSDSNDFLEEFNKHESQREQENHSPADEELMDVDKNELLTDDIIDKVDRLPKRKKRRLSNQSSKAAPTARRLTKDIDFTSSESEHEEEPELKHKNDVAATSTKKIVIPMIKVNNDNINNSIEKKEQPQKQETTETKTLVITHTGGNSSNIIKKKSLIHPKNKSIIPAIKAEEVKSIKSEENNEPTPMITDESEKSNSESDHEDRDEIDSEPDVEFTDVVPMNKDAYESAEDSEFDEEEAEETSSPDEIFDEEDYTFLEIVVKEFEQDPAVYINDSIGAINYDPIGMD
ncbi:4397_t:CDS:2 [Ambispora gerdemannii]|uniref:4397_t:CDS:1 n=1 Tax=Ambispora gerdemannii TaxID=144530 RepID=A0A9N9C5L9_9GLOM|nr:4397_t:CDS:2 [Ambispora gerdemannii]